MISATYTPGAIIANMRLERLLGIGGFGEVWLAEHVDLGDHVAVKIPLVPEYVRVLRLEGRLQHQLDHENIVHVIDLNTTHDPPYCVMEYVDGENLRQRLHEQGKMSLADTRSLSRAILLGLREAHRLGIVHRDLKPENILIARDGKIKIADFGLGSVVHEVTSSVVRSSRPTDYESSSETFGIAQRTTDSIGRSDSLGPLSLSAARILGTYDYMSPEQRAGEDIDARSDVYSLGVMMVEMLTGQRPYGDVMARLQRHDVPRDYSEALLAALDEKPYRHADAEAFMRALRMDLPTVGIRTSGAISEQIEAFLLSIEDRMVFLQGGTFTMGSNDGPENERPAHNCQVASFCLGRFAVTASEFCLFLNDVGGNKSRLFRAGRAATIELVGNLFRPVAGCENHPANCVSHAGATMFCDWMNKRMGGRFRLPTEAEWEFAATGSRPSPEECCYGRQMTTPEDVLCSVDAFPPNPHGLHQMAGNVAEWCLDPYVGNYTRAQSKEGASATSNGRLFVARGGCWSSPLEELEPTRRRVYVGQTFSPGIGFRLARSVGGET